MANKEIGVPRNRDYYDYLYQIGKSFAYEDYFNITKNTYVDFVIDSSTFTKSIFETIIPIVQGSVGPLKIDFYAEPTVTAATGTQLTILNRNSAFAISNPATVKVIQAPTITAIGTRFAGEVVLSSGTNPSNSNSAISGAQLKYRINPSKILMRITNTSTTTDALAHIFFLWFEID